MPSDVSAHWLIAHWRHGSHDENTACSSQLTEPKHFHSQQYSFCIIFFVLRYIPEIAAHRTIGHFAERGIRLRSIVHRSKCHLLLSSLLLWCWVFVLLSDFSIARRNDSAKSQYGYFRIPLSAVFAEALGDNHFGKILFIPKLWSTFFIVATSSSWTGK
jgi:hypothetical protein